MTRRTRRFVAGVCIFAIALAAFLPGAGVAFALPEPVWVLLADAAPVPLVETAGPAAEQPLPLVSLLPSRAPPAPAA